jgi:hypothetical protein
MLFRVIELDSIIFCCCYFVDEKMSTSSSSKKILLKLSEISNLKNLQMCSFSLFLSVCPSLCWSVCCLFLSFCFYVNLFVFLTFPASLSICLSVSMLICLVFYFFLSYFEESLNAKLELNLNVIFSK